MAGYVIAEVQVTDPERYAEYREQVNAGILAYGGRFLARGGKAEALEGDAPRGRLVIAEFDSYEQARAWYYSQENAGPMKLRHEVSAGRLLLVDGV